MGGGGGFVRVDRKVGSEDRAGVRDQLAELGKDRNWTGSRRAEGACR